MQDRGVISKGSDLRKLPGRADRDQSKQERLRRPGQTFQCPTGDRPTGDKRFFEMVAKEE